MFDQKGFLYKVFLYYVKLMYFNIDLNKFFHTILRAGEIYLLPILKVREVVTGYVRPLFLFDHLRQTYFLSDVAIF